MQAPLQQVHWLYKLKTKKLFQTPMSFFVVVVVDVVVCAMQADLHWLIWGYTQMNSNYFPEMITALFMLAIQKVLCLLYSTEWQSMFNRNKQFNKACLRSHCNLQLFLNEKATAKNV